MEILGWTNFLAGRKVERMKGFSLFASPTSFALHFLLLFASNSFAAENPGRSFIPFLDPASQSNVVVTVLSKFGKGDPCPAQFTNRLSNTNLFTMDEQTIIKEALVKYGNVATNAGPVGSVLFSCYKTNVIGLPPYWLETNSSAYTYFMAHRTNEMWISTFQYTNSEAQEEIRFGSGMSAKFTNKSGDGYAVSITQIGSGSLLSYTGKKQGSAAGLLVRFADMHAQGLAWDRSLADFSEGHLQEYMQITNGMAFGKWLMWNPSTGGLVMAAECKEPYDWNNHRMKLPQHLC